MTKIKNFLGVIVLVVAVGAGLHFFNPGSGRNGPGSDEGTVVLKVVFEPAPRKLPVGITVWIDMSKQPSDLTKDSPWVETFVVRRGQTVTLGAVQGEPGPLACMMTISGVTYTEKANPVDGGMCKITRTAS